MRFEADLLGSTGEAAFAVDRDLRIVFWNAAAEAFLGYPACEVAGRTCSEAIGLHDRPAAASAAEPCPTREVLVRTKAGLWIWVRMVTTIVPPRWRERAAVLHFVEDVTRRREMEGFVAGVLSALERFPSAARLARPADPAPAPAMGLTAREREALRLVAEGLATDAIAERLGVSRATARNHVHRIIAKLGVHSRLEAVVLASKLGLIGGSNGGHGAGGSPA